MATHTTRQQEIPTMRLNIDDSKMDKIVELVQEYVDTDYSAIEDFIDGGVVAHMHIVWTDGEKTLVPIYEQDEDKKDKQIVEEYCRLFKRNIHAVEDYWTED
jgi:hypothetical protein